MGELDVNMANCIRGLQELLQFGDEAASPHSVFRELEERSQASHHWPSTSSSAQSTSPEDPSVIDQDNFCRRVTHPKLASRPIAKADNSPRHYFKTYDDLYNRSEASPRTSKLTGSNLYKDNWYNSSPSQSHNSSFHQCQSPIVSPASNVANTSWPDFHASPASNVANTSWPDFHASPASNVANTSWPDFHASPPSNVANTSLPDFHASPASNVANTSWPDFHASPASNVANTSWPDFHASPASNVANTSWSDFHASESPGASSLNSANDSLHCYAHKKTSYAPRGLFIQTYQDTPTRKSYSTKCGSVGLLTLPLPTENITRRKVNKTYQPADSNGPQLKAQQPATHDFNGLQYLSPAAANLKKRTFLKCNCTDHFPDLDQSGSNAHEMIPKAPVVRSQERNEPEMASRRRIVFEQLQYPLAEQPSVHPSDDCVVFKLPLIQKLKQEKVSCNFCMKNGESAEVYLGHPLKRKKGKKLVIVCPILRSLKCHYCNATGDDAHTETYCPVMMARNNGRRQQATTITVKSTRIKSNGQRRY